MPSLEAEIAQLARFIRSDDHKACIAASRTIFIAQSEEDRWPMEETRTSPGFTRRIARDPHASRKSSTKREGRHESARKSLRLELEMEMKNTHVARHCVASNVKPCEAYSLTSITPRSPLRVTHGTRLGNERDKHVSVTGPPVEGPGEEDQASLMPRFTCSLHSYPADPCDIGPVFETFFPLPFPRSA